MALGGYVSSICFHGKRIIVSLNSVSYAPVLRVFFAFPFVVLAWLVSERQDHQLSSAGCSCFLDSELQG